MRFENLLQKIIVDGSHSYADNSHSRLRPWLRVNAINLSTSRSIERPAYPADRDAPPTL